MRDACVLTHSSYRLFFFFNIRFFFFVHQEKTGFDKNSSFIDVGAGLGKPNFHVAQDPGVEISYGLELEVVRWELSIANHRK